MLVDSLTIDTIGSTITDTILQLSDTQCATSIACNDDAGGAAGYLSAITLGGVPAGNYAVTVKAYSSTENGAFKLNVHGTVGKGKYLHRSAVHGQRAQVRRGPAPAPAGTCQ